MPQPNRLLIVSLSTGGGHIQAARALEKTVARDFPHTVCRHIDVADFITPLFKTTTINGYSFLISHLPRVWKSLFKLTDNARIMSAYRTLTNYLKKLNSFDFLHEVKAFRPDHIICTHFLPAEILAHAQKKQSNKIPLTEIITDYGVHPAWVIDGVDTYIVATPSMKQHLTDSFAIPSSAIQTFGIPIDPAFENSEDPAHLKSSYGVSPTNPLILVLAGGSGLIDIVAVLERLFSHITFPATIIAVAGNNKNLYNHITKLTPPSSITYHAYGWTDRISEFMRMASVVVSKPGGLTTTECISLGVPLIAINPIPGQEEFNVEFLSEAGRGAYAPTLTDICSLLDRYLSPDYQPKDRVSSRSAQQIIEFLAS